MCFIHHPIRFLLFISMAIVISHSDAVSYNKYNSSFYKVVNLENTGDLVFAAKLYNIIYKKSNSEKIKAEALYRIADIGRKYADILTERSRFYSQLFYVPQTNPNFEAINNDWENNFAIHTKRDTIELKKVGIRIEKVTHYETYYVCKPNLYKKIAELFPGTRWGESSKYHLILNEDRFIGNPHIVIDRVNIFLADYPNAKHKFDAYCLLAKAYSDLWNFSLIPDYSDMLSKEELQDIDSIRMKAITLFEKIKANKTKLIAEKVNFLENLEELRAKTVTGRFYFFSD